MKKKTIAVVYGGKSAEHEVSLKSAANIFKALDKNKYNVIKIKINKSGLWHLDEKQPISLTPDADNKTLIIGPDGKPLVVVDVFLPILHGTYGEDGCIQGLFKMMGTPFVGPDVLGSAIGMDKEVMKRVMRDNGLPIPNFFAIHQTEPIDYEKIETLGFPVFVKPANLGSSVGISKAHNQKELNEAIDEAFGYDSKVLIEQFVRGRELEVAVIGNGEPSASEVGEICVKKSEFYDYEAKYNDPDAVEICIPADVPKDISSKLKKLAVKAFLACQCEGFSRVDFFLTTENEVLINEINTIPGFTNSSMFPMLWEAACRWIKKLEF